MNIGAAKLVAGAKRGESAHWRMQINRDAQPVKNTGHACIVASAPVDRSPPENCSPRRAARRWSQSAMAAFNGCAVEARILAHRILACAKKTRLRNCGERGSIRRGGGVRYLPNRSWCTCWCSDQSCYGMDRSLSSPRGWFTQVRNWPRKRFTLLPH
jgi:hypothetical protein